MLAAPANTGLRPEVCRDFLKVRDDRPDRPVLPAADPKIVRPSIPSRTPREREGFFWRRRRTPAPTCVGGWLLTQASR